MKRVNQKTSDKAGMPGSDTDKDRSTEVTALTDQEIREVSGGNGKRNAFGVSPVAVIPVAVGPAFPHRHAV
ncbi:hypothetical protein PCA31118_04288 [Pandoraea captiosa]|uniref:Uncharacterized protein n=1 Tax=Pandoraea captiosa TaxID=2508302 RepID=A0A5E5AI47_9BURK|nr:hypothetical protein [Pandoraea captiosa]VVE72716.1 hypothetical protein PCA31118_04288 [Pandoraea captiosa]